MLLFRSLFRSLSGSRVRRLGVLGLAVLLLGTGLSTVEDQPATAIEGTSTVHYLTSTITVSPGQHRQLIVTPQRRLEAGHTIFLQGRVAARSSDTRPIGQVVEIRCLGAPGSGNHGEVRATRNHEGRDFPYATPGQLHVLVDYTFTAPATGMYRCSLNTIAWRSDGASVYLTIVPQETRVLISDQVQADAHNYRQATCNSTGVSPTCQYIGAPGHPDTIFPLYTGVSPTPYIWEMDPAARQVEARGVLQLTNCYRGTASCIDSVDQYGSSSWSTVRARLELIQLTAQNGTCRVFASQPDPRVITITNGAHHFPSTEVIPPVTPDPACPRRFILRFRVAYGSGNPVKVGGLSEGFIQTNGSVFNRY